MIDINKLRRLAQAATPGPDGISLSWVRLLRDFQQGASPAVVSELLDRLEAAEKERDWNAERLEDAIEECAALRAKIETAENDAAHQKALAASALRVAEGWERKCGELRARIEAMERQEPVMWANSSTINSSRINKERGGRGDQHTCSETQITYHDTRLYALPGVKGE